MRKIAILLTMLMVFNSISVLDASAVEFANKSEIEEKSQETITVSGESYTFYKEGTQYKVRRKDGTVSIWAYDVLLSTEKEYNKEPMNRSSSWVYVQTDRYVTYINYEVLLPLLQVADTWATLSAQLGVTIAVIAYIYSVSPEAYYREDITYHYITDPLYFMVVSNFYEDGSYSVLIDSTTHYFYS